MTSARKMWTRQTWRTEVVSDAVRIVIGKGRQKIILARFCPKQLPEAETHANATIASAAPELYAALEKAVETIRTWHGMKFVGRSVDDPGRALEKKAWDIYVEHAPEMQDVRAALAKARGEV